MIGALILGIVAGFLGRALLPGKQSMNIVLTIVLGLAGSLLGFLVFTEILGIGDNEAFDLGGLPGAVIGAMVLLFAYERFVASRSAPSGAPATSAPKARGAKGAKGEESAESAERRRAGEREERRQRREQRDR